MSRKTIGLSEELYDYMLRVSLREPEVLRKLRDETATMEQARMQIAPEQGQLMALVVRLIGARRALEIGVFTGYSSLAVALALPDDGRLVACDVSEEFTNVARRYWAEAGVERKIDLRIAPAEATLAALLDKGMAGTFDFAFIDADKEQYDTYYEQTLKLLRAGGLVAVDNTFWDGKVLDESAVEPSVVAIRAFNEKLTGDSRVDISMLPIADGLTLVRKR